MEGCFQKEMKHPKSWNSWTIGPPLPRNDFCPKDWNFETVVRDLTPGAKIFFWAAMPSNHRFASFQEAYREEGLDSERVPAPGYPNLGMATADVEGAARLRLLLPEGYGTEKAHVHYKVVLSAVSPTQTFYI